MSVMSELRLLLQNVLQLLVLESDSYDAPIAMCAPVRA